MRCKEGTLLYSSRTGNCYGIDAHLSSLFTKSGAFGLVLLLRLSHHALGSSKYFSHRMSAGPFGACKRKMRLTSVQCLVMKNRT